MGQSKAFGGSCYYCNGPTLGHWKYLLKNKLAQAKPLAASARNIMGQSKPNGRSSCQYNGPTLGHWQHPLEK